MDWFPVTFEPLTVDVANMELPEIVLYCVIATANRESSVYVSLLWLMKALDCPLSDLSNVRHQELESCPYSLLAFCQLNSCLSTLLSFHFPYRCTDALKKAYQSFYILPHLLSKIFPRFRFRHCLLYIKSFLARNRATSSCSCSVKLDKTLALVLT